MLSLTPEVDGTRPLRLVFIGAHSDDLEIGCGATVLKWLAGRRPVEVTWVVLSAEGPRASEARASARALLARASAKTIFVGEFRDCYFQTQYSALKAHFESLTRAVEPDIVFSHRLEDRHQDHRLVAELTWNTWRNHMILEYEIPKYDADLGNPNVFVPVSASFARRKVRNLERNFASQRSKSWFTSDTFMGLMRIRGLECRSESGFAEAFHARKVTM